MITAHIQDYETAISQSKAKGRLVFGSLCGIKYLKANKTKLNVGQTAWMDYLNCSFIRVDYLLGIPSEKNSHS